MAAAKRRAPATPTKATKAPPAPRLGKAKKAPPKAKARALSEPVVTIGHFAPSRIDPKRKPWATVTFHPRNVTRPRAAGAPAFTPVGKPPWRTEKET